MFVQLQRRQLLVCLFYSWYCSAAATPQAGDLGGKFPLSNLNYSTEEATQEELPSFWWHFSTQFRQYSLSCKCPFVRLLLLGLVAFSVYNVLVFFVGNWSNIHKAFASFYRLCSKKRGSSKVHLAAATAVEAAAPPVLPLRRKPKKAAPQPPLRQRLRPIAAYPTSQNPFVSHESGEQYRSLRRNLKHVLESLQQPPPTEEAASEADASCSTKPAEELPALNGSHSKIKAKSKSPKLLRSMLKRMRHPFSLRKRANNRAGKNPKTSNILYPLWERLKACRRPRFVLSEVEMSTTSGSTVSSASSRSSCFYVY